eukprot:scaffold20529_cov70-Phaeocystis_antarctica.AAC.2
MANTQALGQSKPRANTITGGMNSIVAFSKRTRPSEVVCCVQKQPRGSRRAYAGEQRSTFPPLLPSPFAA